MTRHPPVITNSSATPAGLMAKAQPGVPFPRASLHFPRNSLLVFCPQASVSYCKQRNNVCARAGFMSKTPRGFFAVPETGPAPGKQPPCTGPDLRVNVPDPLCGDRCFIGSLCGRSSALGGRGYEIGAEQKGESREDPGLPLQGKKGCSGNGPQSSLVGLPFHDRAHRLWAARWGSVHIRVAQASSQATGGTQCPECPDPSFPPEPRGDLIS